MAIAGNIFDNSVTVPPLLEGQGTEPAGDEPIIAPPDAGQGEGIVVEEGDGTQPGEGAAPVSWQDKYKTPEEMYGAMQKLEQSYENLRPKFTKTAMELSQLKKQSAQPPAQQEQPPAAPTAQPQPTAQPNPIDTILGYVNAQIQPVREQNEELMMQNTVIRLAQENPDFKELAPKVQDILKNKPALWNLDDPIETALEIARAQNMKANMGRIVADVKQEVYGDREVKVLNGTQRTAPNQSQPQKTEEERIREGILDSVRYNKSIF
jgi:hypothetical protein